MTKPYANQPNNKPIFNEFITPVGKVVHCYHDKPQLQTTEKTNLPVLDENGIQKADFKVTLWWPKSELDTTLIPLRTLAASTRDEAWPGCLADSWFRLEPFLRDGDSPEHNTKRKDYLFGGVYLNFKTKAQATRLPDGRVTYAGAPGLIGPNNEDLFASDMYAGCMARVSGILFGTEYSGKNFISIRLNNIQKSADGERMGGGGKPDPRSQFEPLQTAPAGGFGTTVL
jgi:hypothetical protein